MTEQSLAPTPAAATIGTIAIVTANRPPQLARCLASYAAHFRAHGREIQLVVVDGSSDPGHARENERLLESGRGPGVGVWYVGARYRRAIRRRLVRNGVPPDLTRWFLPDPRPGYAAGAVRNLMLLSTAGRAILTIDDDTVCRPWSHPRRQPGVGFATGPDPRESFAFRDRHQAVETAMPADVDLLAAHELLLGMRPEEGAAPDAVSFDRRVRATWTGIAGDSGVYCPYPVLFSLGATRDRLAANEAEFRTALESREVQRIVPRSSVTEQPWFMAYCATIDNATLVPPFSPCGYNEDGLFGQMMRWCDPGALMGQIAYGIVHDSPRVSAYTIDHISSASDIRLNDVVQWLARPWMSSCAVTAAEERMISLGRWLIACGEQAKESFAGQVGASILDAKQQLLTACERFSNSGFPYPPYWRDSFRRYQEAVLGSVTDRNWMRVVEHSGLGTADSLRALQSHVRSLGQTLVVWPSIWTDFERRPEVVVPVNVQT